MYSSDAMQPVRVWKVPADVCVRRQAAESPKQGGGEVKVGVGGVKEGWRAATPTFVRAPMVDLDHIPLLVQAPGRFGSPSLSLFNVSCSELHKLLQL